MISYNGNFTLDTSSLGPNLPLTLTVQAADQAGNSSTPTSYTVYTPASLGLLQSPSGGYDSTLKQFYLKWQLAPNPGAQSNILEYGTYDGQNFSVQGSLTPDANGYFTHSGLQPHGTYYYQLVAYNNSGDPTAGQVFSCQVPTTAPAAPVLSNPQPSILLNGTTFVPGTVTLQYTYQTFDVDGDPVTCQLELQGPNDLNFQPVSNALQTTTINNATNTTTVTLPISGLQNGQQYSWRVVAGNPNGQTASSSIGQFVVDAVPPVLTVSPSNIPVYTNLNQLTVSAGDSLSGIKSVTYQIYVNNQPQLPDPAAVVLDATGTGVIPLAEGSYTIQITAVDNVGNTTNPPVSLSLNVDRTAPQINQAVLALPQNGDQYLSSGTLPVNISASDSSTVCGVSDLRYWILQNSNDPLGTGQTVLLSGTTGQYTPVLNLSGAVGQSYYLALAVEDAAGNQSAVSKFGPIILDHTGPQVNFNLTGLTNYASINYLTDLNNLVVNPNATDPAGIANTNYAIIATATGNPVSGWGSWDQVKQAILTAGATYQVEVQVINNLGLETDAWSPAFVFDNAPPQNLSISGLDEPSLCSNEAVVFTVTANDPILPIVQYRFSISDGSSSPALTAGVPGNDNGWLEIDSGTAPVQFRFTMPEAVSGTYYPVLQVVNAAGLTTTYNGNPLTIDNSAEKLTVSDQGPYSMFSDHLAGSWQYFGTRTVTGYQYQLIDSATGQIVTDWNTTANTSVTVSGLTLVSGENYHFIVQADFSDGTTLTGSSPGVTIDLTPPIITSLVTPAYCTSANLNFTWEANDPESGINQEWVALGSNPDGTDILGWVLIQNFTTALANLTTPLKDGQQYYLTLRVSNDAGLEADTTAPAITIVNNPPPVPVIVDQGVDINPTLQPLEANWTWTPANPADGPVSYQWTLLSGGASLASAVWNDVGQQTSVSTDPDLAEGPYYFVVKATNLAGLTSTGLSDVLTIDKTAPAIPDVTLLQINQSGVPQDAVYLSNTSNLELAITSYDLNGVFNYDYTYGDQSSITQDTQYTTSYSAEFFINPVIQPNVITIFKSICVDQANNISPPGYSCGVLLDNTIPQVTNFNSYISGSNLIFNWNVTGVQDIDQPLLAPLSYCQYALIPDSQTGSDPTGWNWTNVQLNRSGSLYLDQNLYPDGCYDLYVRAFNAAGTGSLLDVDGCSVKVIVDRQPPVLDLTQFVYPNYADSQIAFQVAAEPNPSGIADYQYALGTQTDPFFYSNGWMDFMPVNGSFSIPGDIVKSLSPGTTVYLMVRARSNGGLWSDALISGPITIDHSPPALQGVSCNAYTNSKTQITGISFNSYDTLSGITEYKVSIVTPDQELITVMDFPVTWSTNLNINNQTLTLTGGLQLNDGVYYIGVQTCNGVGIWSQVDLQDEPAVTVDTIPPVFSFTTLAGNIFAPNTPINIPYNLSEPATVQFTLTGADGAVQTYNVTGQSGTNGFTFQAGVPESYQLTALATDLAGNIGVAQTQSILVNAPPQITLPASFNTTPGAPLQFSATVIDTYGNPLNYSWNTGVIGAPLLSGAAPVYQYQQAGTYPLTLTVTDNDGGVSQASTTVYVQNTSQGNLYANETWSGTWNLYGAVTVPAGITLTVSPGTQIIVNPDPVTGTAGSLDIQGTLTIQGAGQVVAFSSATGQAGDWKGIYVEGQATLDQVLIRDAERGLAVVNGATATITNCTFQNNQAGLHVFGTQPTVTNCSFINNTIFGIKEDNGGRPIVTGSLFSGNVIDYYNENMTKITIDQLNQINGNSGNRSQ